MAELKLIDESLDKKQKYMKYFTLFSLNVELKDGKHINYQDIKLSKYKRLIKALNY